MSDEDSVRIPESPEDAVSMVEEDVDDAELDDQKRNLIRAQKRLIDGDSE